MDVHLYPPQDDPRHSLALGSNTLSQGLLQPFQEETLRATRITLAPPPAVT